MVDRARRVSQPVAVEFSEPLDGCEVFFGWLFSERRLEQPAQSVPVFCSLEQDRETVRSFAAERLVDA